jgi:hypothetical protein
LVILEIGSHFFTQGSLDLNPSILGWHPTIFSIEMVVSWTFLL